MGRNIPIALAAAILLDLLGVDIEMTRLGKEAGQMFSGTGGAGGEALVVTVVCLVGASH